MLESFSWDQRGRMQDVRVKRRSKVPTPQYYIIDFGVSLMFPSYEERQLASGRAGTVRPDEMSLGPYDPFPVDIFAFGVFVNSMRRVSLAHCAQILN